MFTYFSMRTYIITYSNFNFSLIFTNYSIDFSIDLLFIHVLISLIT